MSSFPKTDGVWQGEDGGSCSLTHLEGPGGGRLLVNRCHDPKSKAVLQMWLSCMMATIQPGLVAHAKPMLTGLVISVPQTELTKHDL